MAALPCLHVCTTCRAGRPLAEGDTPPGQRLFDAVSTALGTHAAPPVELRGVACLASCDQGCTAAISAPGKWSYLLGHLAPDDAADILAYGVTYAASPSGTVLPSRRPASLRHAILGRLPALGEAA